MSDLYKKSLTKMAPMDAGRPRDMSQDEADDLLSSELMSRYGGSDPYAAANRFLQEASPGAKVKEDPRLRSNDGSRVIPGAFDRKDETLWINPTYSKDTQGATLAHEGLHRREYVQNPIEDLKRDENWHFRDTKSPDIEPLLAQHLRAQKIMSMDPVERSIFGEAINPLLLERYPELKDINPASSNRLVLPGKK